MYCKSYSYEYCNKSNAHNVIYAQQNKNSTCHLHLWPWKTIIGVYNGSCFGSLLYRSTTLLNRIKQTPRATPALHKIDKSWLKNLDKEIYNSCKLFAGLWRKWPATQNWCGVVGGGGGVMVIIIYSFLYKDNWPFLDNCRTDVLGVGANVTSEWHQNNEIVIVFEVILWEDVFCPPRRLLHECILSVPHLSQNSQ